MGNEIPHFCNVCHQKVFDGEGSVFVVTHMQYCERSIYPVGIWYICWDCFLPHHEALAKEAMDLPGAKWVKEKP